MISKRHLTSFSAMRNCSPETTVARRVRRISYPPSYAFVTDTGCGIPKEELAGLFAEFKRLKGTTNIEGTGLGLFIVKTIVEAHDGTVTVESKEGVGTTFTMLLSASRDFLGGIQPENASKGAETGISGEHHIVRHGVEEQARIQ